MRKLYISFIVCFVNLTISGFSQTITRIDSLQAIAERESRIYLIKKSQAVEWAKVNGYPVKTEIDGSFLEIQYIDKNGHPQYYKTDNINAAATISTNKVYPGGGAGLSLTGSGITVREWDGGSVLSTHQEFGSRVTVVNAVATHYHSTHVAGTIMASGVVANAKGMAYQASLRSFDWNSDLSEMATEGAAGALISNHSYGYIRGWYSGTWYGDPAISTLEDYLFGFYDSDTQQWDQVALNAPYFLICKSAGNDRGNSGDGTYPADGPYDCIGQQGVAKNILTVGAVDDIPGGYTGSSGVLQTNTYFSSWGPADDGRIKPDIVANGYSLYSTYNTNNTSYASLSGTSMATPSAAGSLALLQQHHYTLYGSYMRAATLKALVIHTADEAGPNTGPDYMFGWGLMNTKNAALKISAEQTTDVISELTLSNGGIYIRDVVALGTEPLKVTIVWTDQLGTPPAASLDPITPMLVNDLDLRITRSGSTFYPWKLDRNNPANAATNAAENNVDNVEVVYIASPVAGGTYTITVDHDGTLGSPQAYSIIISGILSTVPPVADFVANNTNPSINTQVNFTDNSTNIPTSWNWSFSPSSVSYLNGTTSASQNPQVQFTAAGLYTVTLTSTNAYGSDAEIKANYINVVNCTFNILPFIENFSGTTIPTCWTQLDNQGNGQIWQFGTITGQSPNPALNGNYAYLNSDAYGSGNSQNADLISPTFNLSAYSAVTLQFNHYFKAYTGSSGKLSYSINNGSSWTLLTTFSTTSATNPAAYSQAVSAVAGQSQVKFKWNYTGTYGWYWGVDDIQITGTCASNLPVSVSIAASANPVCAGTSVTFTPTPVNGGTPTYQWHKNSVSVGTGSTYSFIPVTGDQVYVIMASSLSCITGNPATSNTVTMTAYAPLTANFSADKLTPQKNETVTFSDLTTGGATAWNWSFDRPGVVFVNGTSASSQNPKVQFTDGGLYQVTLLATHLPCSDSEIKSGYIRSGISGQWSGNTSSDWNILSNWDNYLVPDGNTDVVIPSSASFWPVFTGDFILGTHGRNLILSGTNSKITITGNLVVQ